MEAAPAKTCAMRLTEPLPEQVHTALERIERWRGF